MKNILITGGAGYIGSHIAEQLEGTNYNIFLIDNLVNGYRKLINKKAKFFKLDIKNFKKLKAIITKNKIDTIIHLAAYLNIRESELNKNKYYKNNVIGTENLIRCCKESLVSNIVYSSSCSIYGNVNGSVNENKKPNPKSYYALTKYIGEEIIKKYEKKYKYRFAILRYFNVVGASSSKKIGEINMSNGHLFKNIAIQSLKKKPKIYIYGKNYKTKDGTCLRDYIHVSDLAEIHLKSLQYLNKKKRSLILNCGYGKAHSVKDIAYIFKKIQKNVTIIYKKKRLGDVGQVFSNTKKLKRILKFKPKYNDINKMLISAINWEKKIHKIDKR